MRILFLTNFYPPARAGGYAHRCFETATGLQALGYNVRVVTSRHGRDQIGASEANVFRVLHLEGDLEYYRPVRFFLTWRRQHEENLRNFEAIIRSFAPDILFVWGMWALSRALPALGEALLPGRVVYSLADYWPASADMHQAYWSLPPQHWYMRRPKKILAAAAMAVLGDRTKAELQFTHAVCVSAALREALVAAGVPVGHAAIIHGGTDPAAFYDPTPRDFARRPLRLLYAGQLVSNKGVRTALEGLARCLPWAGDSCLTLAVVGAGHPDYEASLRDFVKQENLSRLVTFHGSVPRRRMPEVLRQADVLLFPSIYDEPFARMIQEAMLAGLVVVGTTTGGTKELLDHEQNGLTFGAGDADDLARQIKRLATEPELCARLAAAGCQTVLERFTLAGMIEKTERYLLSVGPTV